MEFLEENTIRVYRTAEISPNALEIGDRIKLGRGYTATCQELTADGALFILDSYFETPIAMNTAKTNKGGYMDSDLRMAFNARALLGIFDDYRDLMTPFSNGDLLRLPCYGEIFGEEDAELFTPDGGQQWPLMQDKRNRSARVHGTKQSTWGWLQNKKEGSTTAFAVIGTHGHAGYFNEATAMGGLRPVFKIAKVQEAAPKKKAASKKTASKKADTEATLEENEYDVTFD